ncbi:hypothetical protein ACI3PL_31620, partial [Lacticaseibacillus paracasei]
MSEKWKKRPLNIEVDEISICEPEVTYDLECDGHLFIANGMVPHNCIVIDELSAVQQDTEALTACSQSSPCR